MGNPEELCPISPCVFCWDNTGVLISDDKGYFVGCSRCYHRGPYNERGIIAIKQWNSIRTLRPRERGNENERP